MQPTWEARDGRSSGGPLGAEGWDSQCFSAAATLSHSRFGVKPHHSPHRGTFCHFLAHQNKTQTPPASSPTSSVPGLSAVPRRESFTYKALPYSAWPFSSNSKFCSDVISSERPSLITQSETSSLYLHASSPRSFFLYCTYPCMKLSFLFIILTWFIGSVSP